MSKLCALFSLLSLLSIVWPAAAEQYARPEMLVEPAALAKPEIARQYVILDVRPQSEFAAGRIPGARQVDHDAWSKAFGEGKDAQAWSARFGALGIGPQSKVVVYDGKGLKEAARVWWILRYWGLEGVALLNGDWQAWKAAGLPIETAPPTKAAPAAFVAQARKERFADKAQMLDWVKSQSLQIVDTRSAKEFCGEDFYENKNNRAGAMPGAKHLDWADLIDPKTRGFKSAAELQKLFSQAGIDVARPIATHCQSGGRASVMVFAMELLGARDVRNYYQGWSEWGNAADTPVVASPPAKPPAALSFTMPALAGGDVELRKYAGKVVLIVNVASKCGLTPQYTQLQALHEKYGKQGLAVLGFPCNQFKGQEPGGPEEIRKFCTANYGVTFPLFAKIEVNGDGACGLYRHLTALDAKPAGAGKITWNFEKFLVGRDGQVVARWSPRTKPDAPEVLTRIEEELAKK